MPALEPVMFEPIKSRKPTIAAGITVSKLPPRQSTLILQDVADRHGVTVDDIKSPLRIKRVVIARQEAYYLLREAGYSFPQVGRFCGGRDHSTVVHGVGMHENKLKGRVK
jgi:chromosomal replication initiation ATPase DnaA